jgi:hypothetical protein
MFAVLREAHSQYRPILVETKDQFPVVMRGRRGPKQKGCHASHQGIATTPPLRFVVVGTVRVGIGSWPFAKQDDADATTTICKSLAVFCGYSGRKRRHAGSVVVVVVVLLDVISVVLVR